ncbi:MAG: LamB/YcsF family protein [Saprospiraceae bacterium]|nr:LamB/YcsF family protein [Saprospiraceae bacterium]
MARIDINCDMGESYGNFKIGKDSAIFPYITSCNIACGFHGGDPLHIEKTIKGALAYDVQIGAHPSYPDLAGFGRRNMQIPEEELRALVKYQISAIKGMVESLGGRLQYVKPHGALYNTAAHEAREAMAIIKAIQEVDDSLYLMGLAGSPIQELAAEQQIPFVAEAFADRKYMKDGRLRSRSAIGAVIESAEEAAQQVVDIVLQQRVETYEGEYWPLEAQSICIHGDNPAAVAVLQTIDQKLEQEKITKVGFTHG